MRRPALVLAACALSLTACTGSSKDEAGPTAAPARPSDCPTAESSTQVPADCVEDSKDFDYVATPTAKPTGSSADLASVVLPEDPQDLARGGNDTDPTKKTQTFKVVVPAGSRLRTTAACEGADKIVLTTVPDSAAAQEFTCGFEGTPAELTVEDSVPVKTATTFTVTVTTTPPSRWYVAVGATSAPPPPDAVSQS
ncbi:MAG: hypothetical protein JWN17_2206 [Frankiales bacterium]|nr:hypothetical protein [Frankiales bacterium]